MRLIILWVLSILITVRLNKRFWLEAYSHFNGFLTQPTSPFILELKGIEIDGTGKIPEDLIGGIYARFDKLFKQQKQSINGLLLLNCIKLDFLINYCNEVWYKLQN